MCETNLADFLLNTNSFTAKNACLHLIIQMFFDRLGVITDERLRGKTYLCFMELDFSAKYLLENDYVRLRPLEVEDWMHLLPYSLNEPDLWKYSLVPMAGEENLRAYVIGAVKSRAEQKEYPFIVYDKRAQAYAGCTRFYDIQRSFRTLQLGYTWYGKEFQGTGLNKNCKYLLLEFAFEKLGMLRVEFRADNNNARSIAAMKSIGCVAEGVLRQNVPTADGGRRDSIVLSILHNEWTSGVKNRLAEKIRTRASS